MSRIYAVDSVDIALQKSLPPNLLVEVCGRTSTSGWSNIALVPFIYVMPPADGVLDCDVMGDPPPPGAIVLQVLTKVRAHMVIDQVDIANYWGPGLPLRGVRCHAQSNSKVRLMEPVPGMAPVTELIDPASKDTETLSFERDIRPLFRQEDVGVMISVRNLDLSSHEDVSAHAKLILDRLEDGTMPCDGGWPATDVDLFRRWAEQGMKE
jgi:hypothetical protein